MLGKTFMQLHVPGNSMRLGKWHPLQGKGRQSTVATSRSGTIIRTSSTGNAINLLYAYLPLSPASPSVLPASRAPAPSSGFQGNEHRCNSRIDCLRFLKSSMYRFIWANMGRGFAAEQVNTPRFWKHHCLRLPQSVPKAETRVLSIELWFGPRKVSKHSTRLNII